jgi:hypothetical protein
METNKHEEITPYSKKRTGKLASIKFNIGPIEYKTYMVNVPEYESVLHP